MVVSAYGADGPAANRIANDLTLSAMGGQASLQGSPDRPPVRVSIPQVWRHASAQAAAAAMIAHARMQVTGSAQFVDVSAQVAATWTMMNAMDAHAIQGFEFERMGSVVQMGTREVDPVFECADGHLVALPIGGVLNALLGHVAADGLLEGDWLTEDWETFDQRMGEGQETNFSREELRDLFVRFFGCTQKRSCLRWGSKQASHWHPSTLLPNLTQFEQLDVRDAWDEVNLPDSSKARTPGIFAKLNNSPMTIRTRPPGLNEHAQEIRDELKAGVRALAQAPSPQPDGDYPFKGLKVLDLTWVDRRTCIGPISFGSWRYCRQGGV